MRLALTGLVGAGVLALALILGWSVSAALRTTAASDQDWRQREMLFLKAAYERLTADLDRRASHSPSLRAERDRILRNMAETGKLLPVERIPPEIARLLAMAPAAPPPETISDLFEAAAAEPIPDLRLGLGSSQEPGLDLADFVVDPRLRQPINPAPVARKAQAAATATPKPSKPAER